MGLGDLGVLVVALLVLVVLVELLVTVGGGLVACGYLLLTAGAGGVQVDAVESRSPVGGRTERMA